MERIVKEIPLDCEIALISDTHIGSKKAHITGIQRAVDFVKKKPNRFWIHLGDWIEAITTDDKRYETETTEQPIPELQAKEAIEIFGSIAGQGICGLLGNHERKLSRTINFGRMICEGLNIPYATESARVLFEHEGRLLFKFFISHGNKVFRSNAKDFIQREANKKAALKVSLQYKMGDCSLMACGHAHWLGIVPPAKLLYLQDTESGIKHKYLNQDETPDGYIDFDRRWYCCYDKETEILTQNGYKLFCDLSEKDEVIAYDPETTNLSLMKPTRIIAQHYKGDMIHFDSGRIDIMVTPDHNMFTIKENGGYEFIKAEKLEAQKKSEQKIPNKSKGIYSPYNEKIKIGCKEYDINLFMEFLGWYFSEGFAPRLTGKNRSNKYEIMICQSLSANPKKYADIRILCAKLFDRIGCVQAGVYVKGEDELAEFLLQFGTKSINKHIPQQFKNMDAKLLRLFLSAFCAGDGTIYEGKNAYYTSSQQLANDIYEMIIKAGGSASINYTQPKNKNWNRQYRILELYSKTHSISGKYIKREPYDDTVYCVELPEHHIINVRRNGKNVYCGNCTGSFYKLFIDGISGYNEPFDPNDLGFLVVKIEGGKIVDVKEIIV